MLWWLATAADLAVTDVRDFVNWFGRRWADTPVIERGGLRRRSDVGKARRAVEQALGEGRLPAWSVIRRGDALDVEVNWSR